ncbi:sensor domain-containing diguanylate cyclase [Nitrincola alkalilacustris]|uniref:sensor domain-containing diguanylate cyclase n=1 Tax=Nitrincola alkalilacustris TaxID=1571224 RepID=UPI00124C954D|nr:sensor domain-containing diguanylate cyclase [Nitrincola alkalilacustris]
MDDINKLAVENRELKRLVHLMQNKATRNEALLHNFFEAELLMLSCSSLAELLNYLLNDFRQHFKLCAVGLVLFDPEETAQELLDSSSITLDQSHLRLLPTQQLLREIHPENRLFYGQPDSRLKQQVFEHSPVINSCAILPLIRENCLIGSLSLGSMDPDRYNQFLSYDYLSHLSSVVAVCIENCIRRETLQRLSSIDALTKTLNRRAFNLQLMRELKRSSRTDAPFACMLVDIDHFKRINDSFGHLTGDRVLRAVAELLKELVRDTDTVARYGGEEFAILLPGCDHSDALQVAENLRQKLHAYPFETHQGTVLNLSASFGFTICEPKDIATEDMNGLMEQLIHAADQALYQSKERGRNQTHFLTLNPKSSTPLIAEADQR